MKARIDIEIKNIKVGKRYYSFDYKVKFNGKLLDENSYSSSHSRSDSYMRKELKKDYAVMLVLQQIS